MDHQHEMEIPASSERLDLANLGDYSYPLLFSGLCLYALYLLNVSLVAFPPRLLDPNWNQVVIDALASAAILPVLGTCLMLLADYLDHSSQLVDRVVRFFRRWIWVVAVVYLLTIPMQAYSSIQAHRAAVNPLNDQLSSLEYLIGEVGESTDIQSLRASVKKLPGNPEIPAGFTGPLEPFKKQVVGKINEAIGKLKQSIATRRRASYIQGARRILRVSVNSLIVAMVLLAFSQRDLDHPSLANAFFLRRKYRRASKAQAPAYQEPNIGDDEVDFSQIP